MTDKELTLSSDEMVEYVRENVKVGDQLEIAYNRIFAPGEVLTIIEEDEETGAGLTLGLQLTGEFLNQSVDVDLEEIKDEILEMHHIHDGETTIIEAEMPEPNYSY